MEVLPPRSFNDFFKSNLQEIRQKGERFGTTSPCISYNQNKSHEKGKGKQWKGSDLGSKERQVLLVPQQTKKQRQPQSLQDFVNNQLMQIREKGECLGTTSPCEKKERSNVAGKEKGSQSNKMKEPKVGSWDYINNLEEQERSRRLTELAIHKEIPSSSESNLARECEIRKRRFKFTRDLEESERAWRLRTLFSKHYDRLEEQRASYIASHRGYQGKCKILDAPRSGVQSNVNELEEQERQRRMNERKEAEKESEREREQAMDFARRAEEEERQRRMKLLEKSRKGGFRNVESEIAKSSEIKSGEEKSRE